MHDFVTAQRFVTVILEDGTAVKIPLAFGVLKHLSLGQLEDLITDPAVARKYTLEALRVAPWALLKSFPEEWVRCNLPHASMPESRRQALAFLFGS